MKVQVQCGFDTVKYVDAVNLKRLIAGKKIVAFRRSDGWITLGTDSVRGSGGKDYNGPERRNIVQKPLSRDSLSGKLLCVLGMRGPKVDW